MRFAKWVFLSAGLSGILIVAPAFFLERQTGEDSPPPITHPEYYYGFLGVTLAWQFLFLIIASDPVRFRPTMLAAMLEKIGFAAAVWILYAVGRDPGLMRGFAAMDATWLVLFVIAYWLTPKTAEGPWGTN